MLLESHVDFVCLDNEDVHRRSIHVIANMAEEETRKVSDRSKTALAAAKARGVKLGSADPRLWKGREHLRGTKKPSRRRQKWKREATRNTYAFPDAANQEMRERGGTLPEIVEWLNQQEYTTTAGKPFTQTAVWRLLERYLGKEYLGSTRKKTTGCKVGVRNRASRASGSILIVFIAVSVIHQQGLSEPSRFLESQQQGNHGEAKRNEEA